MFRRGGAGPWDTDPRADGWRGDNPPLGGPVGVGLVPDLDASSIALESCRDRVAGDVRQVSRGEVTIAAAGGRDFDDTVTLVAGMKERMLRGELYLADDPELAADFAHAQELLERFNATRHTEQEERTRLLRLLLGGVGEGVVVRPTFRCDYGAHVTIGAGTFVNYDCVFLDVAPIQIGASCQIAPRVQLVTATHPIDPELRRAGWESGRPITIGDNVWLGGGSIVCPGVGIGDNTVVGAGAVVTRDLPAGVIAVGSPARVHREIADAPS